MSVGPRVVFVRFTSSASPKLVPWVSHAGRVVGNGSVSQNLNGPAESQERLIWQLVSANNRQLARGTDIYTSFDAARTHVDRVASSSEELLVELVSEAGRGVYGWYASLEGVPVMTCARWYLTDRDRRHSINLATRCLPVAMLHDGARLSDPALMGGAGGSSG